jgi:hypothetical protein
MRTTPHRGDITQDATTEPPPRVMLCIVDGDAVLWGSGTPLGLAQHARDVTDG